MTLGSLGYSGTEYITQYRNLSPALQSLAALTMTAVSSRSDTYLIHLSFLVSSYQRSKQRMHSKLNPFLCKNCSKIRKPITFFNPTYMEVHLTPSLESNVEIRTVYSAVWEIIWL
jgi:hypothetical protein